METAGTKQDLENRNRPIRYRLIDGDGKASLPFRLKPGVSLSQIAANMVGSKGGWRIEVVGADR